MPRGPKGASRGGVVGARAETAVAALSTGVAGAQAGLRQEPGDGGGGRFGDAANRDAA